jgi:hypothetical protein
MARQIALPSFKVMSTLVISDIALDESALHSSRVMLSTFAIRFSTSGLKGAALSLLGMLRSYC